MDIPASLDVALLVGHFHSISGLSFGEVQLLGQALDTSTSKTKYHYLFFPDATRN